VLSIGIITIVIADIIQQCLFKVHWRQCLVFKHGCAWLSDEQTIRNSNWVYPLPPTWRPNYVRCLCCY